MKFTEDQKRWLVSEGVSRQLILQWERKGRVGAKYLRLVAKVTGVKDPLDLVDPQPNAEPAA